MHRQADQVKRRSSTNPSLRVRNVDIARGRTGYGFTLSGQAPCVLSCILKGSPAHYVGLRSGDRILNVNDINVSKASHEDVVKLIGQCTGVLRLIIAEGSNHSDTGSSDEELYFNEGKVAWMSSKPKSKTLGLNRAEKVVADVQSGGIFKMLFDNSSNSTKCGRTYIEQQKQVAEKASGFPARRGSAKTNHNSLSEEEVMKVLNDDSVFVNGLENQDGFVLDASILNVGMIVGYLGSIELPSTSSNLENDSLQAIRGCMRRLRAEQKIHTLVLMKIMHDSIKLFNDKNVVLAVYPAEKLAFSAVCPDDRRFFGLVTMQISDDHSLASENDGGLRTSCHVFMVDPDLCQHKIHQGIARRFSIECTPDPDTSGCLEFPPSSQPVLQFVSVLYKDMGESFESMRARAFLDGDLSDGQQNNSTGSNSDSGIGCYSQEEKNNRVLVVDLGTNSNKHGPHGAWSNVPGKGQMQGTSQWNGCRPDLESKFHAPRLSELAQNDCSLLNGNRHLGPSARLDVPGASPWSVFTSAKKSDIANSAPCSTPRWLPLHIRKDWQYCSSSDQESYAESTDGLSSVNCSTLKQDLPPPMTKIQTEKYRVGSGLGQPFHIVSQKNELTSKLFGIEKMFGIQQNNKKSKDKKGTKFSGIAVGFPQASQRSSVRRSYGRSKRFSITRSLDDLETAAVSDGELNSADLKTYNSENSINSNASLPSVQSCRKHAERQVASWAVCFERLLQDPVGIRYFSEFLKKEFSEENILFWQNCEYFSQISQHDKKQLLYRAREIYNNFLSNKALTPVNIDSQAQLADDIINAPHPDMFKEQQLQIFNLMKFDSYSRFLKSTLYQECMLAEVEGRPLPDPCRVPCSPTSRHSASLDRSDHSTPNKSSTKIKSGRLLPIELEDDNGNKKRGTFFSWSRRSLGRTQKRKENGGSHADLSESNGLSQWRRESFGSMSSSTSTEGMASGCPRNNKQEYISTKVPVAEKEKPSKHCTVSLPDGSLHTVSIQTGVSIRGLLTELCEKMQIQLAAVDLFLVGGDKPLVLDQDCNTLNSREIRLEKRTLFRLDLVPINRSVGLKAKPTKPVTEVLRPVVAKYGLNLSDLVARINGESEALDLGVPISNLDGQRVVLDVAEYVKEKDREKFAGGKMGSSNVGAHQHGVKEDGRPVEKPFTVRGNGKSSKDARPSKKDIIQTTNKKRQPKLNMDEVEEFFDLLSKAQSNRVNDQRGLLKKEDLVLPDFLRLKPPIFEPDSSTPSASKGNGRKQEGKSQTAHRNVMSAQHSDKLEYTDSSTAISSALNFNENSNNMKAKPTTQHASCQQPVLVPPDYVRPDTKQINDAPFYVPVSPIPHVNEQRWEKRSGDWQLETVPPYEDENAFDLTLVAEGDINSPNSTLLPPPPTPPSTVSKLEIANYTPPTPYTDGQENSSHCRSTSDSMNERGKIAWMKPACFGQNPNTQTSLNRTVLAMSTNHSHAGLPVNKIIDIDGVKSEDARARTEDSDGNLSFEGYISELKSCQGRMRTGVYRMSELPSLITVKSERSKTLEAQHKATFV
ncbi:regulator of G-protein signaling 12b [Carcharodon carcharias]|uniref:regulator of G-protein signaling 12b n=1 Tax=Carcharodon carcharias TaxID=13397 RepID=UPI001B7F18A4|nr:regulator of G-protein signaling 12b [Carcharodon carcharias]XP_041041685.1 regulator of G-protein signaling 12b [Carcharodon carcharias]XP_041041686.1 regulator of G-protein signaling 12b [Carcharodon carcharias]